MSFAVGAEIWSAAAIASLSTDLFVHPMETVITRIQSPRYTKTYKTTNGNLSRSLFIGLYQGFGPTLIAGIPSSAAFFTVYEGMKRTLQRARSDGFLRGVPLSAVHVASSGAAELVYCAIANPAQVLKQNAQVQQADGGRRPPGWHTVQALRSFARHPARLWTGYAALVASNLPATCVTFGLYEHLKVVLLERLSNGDPRTASISTQVKVSAVSAGLAGGFASGFMVPIDVIRTRMRLTAGGHGGYTERLLNRSRGGISGGQQSSREAGFLKIARETFRTEGVGGFFRGFILTCVAATVGSGLYLGCYEGVKLYLEPQTGRDKRSEHSL